jgi:integral membrane sensor domain MASE1
MTSALISQVEGVGDMSIPTFGDLRRKFFGGVRHAIWRIFQGGLIGFLLGALAVEIAAYFLNGANGATVWPPTLFAHVAAIGFAIALAYAVALTVALTEGIKGMVTVAESLDDVAKTTIDSGLNVVDNVVDAVDGPDRHGIR